VHKLASLPRPDAQISASISADEIFSSVSCRAIRKIQLDRVSSGVVAAEALLSVLAEAVAAAVDDDLVVAALEGNEFFRWMMYTPCHAEHVRLGDKFDGNWNSPLPCSVSNISTCDRYRCNECNIP